jgi:hypothetical protein
MSISVAFVHSHSVCSAAIIVAIVAVFAIGDVAAESEFVTEITGRTLRSFARNNARTGAAAAARRRARRH